MTHRLLGQNNIFLNGTNIRTELRLRQSPSYTAKRDMVGQAGMKSRTACGLVRLSSVAKPSWMGAGKLMRAFSSTSSG